MAGYTHLSPSFISVRASERKLTFKGRLRAQPHSERRTTAASCPQTRSYSVRSLFLNKCSPSNHKNVIPVFPQRGESGRECVYGMRLSTKILVFHPRILSGAFPCHVVSLKKCITYRRAANKVLRYCGNTMEQRGMSGHHGDSSSYNNRPSAEVTRVCVCTCMGVHIYMSVHNTQLPIETPSPWQPGWEVSTATLVKYRREERSEKRKE